jgi:hypothetical protein
MMSSGVLHRVVLVRTDVSEELSASFIRVTRIGELGTTLAVTSSMHHLLVTASVVHSSLILVTLMKEALIFSETSVLTRATLSNTPEDTIVHIFFCLYFYIMMKVFSNCSLQGLENFSCFPRTIFIVYAYSLRLDF